MVKIVSWNVHQTDLLDDVGDDVEVVLLQECPAAVRGAAGWDVFPTRGDWYTDAPRWPWRTAVAVRQSSGLRATEIPLTGLDVAVAGGVAVSRYGSISAVVIHGVGERDLVLTSVYARWEGERGGVIWADASAHRLLSDLSEFLTSSQPARDLLISGDWNILYGYGERGSPYWKSRYDSVFQRADAMGLTYVGPTSATGGRQALPWPDELPENSTTVPTFRPKITDPATATRQLDHVFVNDRLASRVTATALNTDERWGRSDHCRVLIEVSPT